MRWAEITIEATPGAQDAVDEALRSAGCDGVLIRDSAAPPQVAGYLPVDDRLEGRLDALQTALNRLPEFGIEGAGTELTLRYVEEADWANAWKAFYKPMRVGRHLVVTPPWETPELGPGDIPLVIDPGMAFGTGSHPTTQLCLAALEEYLMPGMRVADIGTGSGILAIAAAKMGASDVLATDIDPLAVKIAAENVGVNGGAVRTQEAFPTGAFDLVVANILADVIIGLSDELAALVTPDGLLIASGIIDTRETDVRFAVEGAGFNPLETRRQSEWVALVFPAERRVTRFFVRPEQIQDGVATLDEGDAHHLRVVLHANAGAPATILDGTGRAYPGRLEEVGKTRAKVRLGTPFVPQTEPKVKITVAQALPKMAEKMEQVLQHGTEIGAAAFWAYSSERSLTHLTGERQAKRLVRWAGIIKTAAEQSHRALLPSLRVDGGIGDVLAEITSFDLALLAHPEQCVPLRAALSAATAPASVLVIVGPESGFTDAEVNIATRSGAQVISLGPRILRTETAALALAAQLLYALEADPVR